MQDNAIRVMLVDDHKTMLWGLEKLLAGAHPAMRVVGSAGDIDTALAMAADKLPDVVLLDIDLGGVSSVDFLPALLAGGAARALMFSGTRDQDELCRAVRSGARGVVGKDASAEQLIAAIARVHCGEMALEPALFERLLGAMTRPAASVVQDPQAARVAAQIAQLTAKERKIIAMMAEGNGALNKTIAQRAFISEQTLRNHLTTIYQKLDVANRLELYVFAGKHGLDKLPE